MSKVTVKAFSISLDGFGAGPEQDLNNPLGVGGQGLFETWMYPTKNFQTILGKQGGSVGVDNDFLERSFDNVGAWIMGRNMFGPIRGDWPNDEWTGWWGEEPPFHGPVFVLTHHERKSFTMNGGTSFHFITDGIKKAMAEAKKAAGNKDIRIGGGVSVIRQFLQSGYIDEMHLAISPFFLGTGEHLFSGINLTKLGFNKIQKINGEGATHILVTK